MNVLQEFVHNISLLKLIRRKANQEKYIFTCLKEASFYWTELNRISLLPLSDNHLFLLLVKNLTSKSNLFFSRKAPK